MSDDAIAVIGTRRTMRELVDGTIRIQIDIDPQYRSMFLQHYPLDAAVAIVPVKAGPAPIVPKPDKPGPLCVLAGQWSHEPDFCMWANEAFPAICKVLGIEFSGRPMSETLGELVRRVCGIRTRRELDINPAAAAIFHEKIREPFMAYLKEQGE